MTPTAALPDWVALLTAILTLLGATLTLIGALGLLRFGNFYRRVHAPTLGTTLGAGFILIGSMVCFSVLESRPVLHEILIAVFMTITTPVTLMLLVRAGVSRDLREGSPEVSMLRDSRIQTSGGRRNVHPPAGSPPADSVER
jgi:multicomponent K+:H+ antiporter subunit G